MKQLALALLGIGSTLVSGISGAVQPNDLVVNFNTPIDNTETKTSEATLEQPTTPTPPPKGGNAPCIACGMG